MADSEEKANLSESQGRKATGLRRNARHASGVATRPLGRVSAASGDDSRHTKVTMIRSIQQRCELSGSSMIHALIDGVLAFTAVGCVAFGLDAIFSSLH